jgi:AbrB family looped-hinge helix DNA binding protein
MTYTATITSKRQMTIPVGLFRALGLKEGEKIVLSEKDGKFEAESALALVERLAGSLKVPKRFVGKTEEEIVNKAREEYFRKKYKNFNQ